MCGIAGIVGPGAATQTSLAQSMADLLCHRGPDDAGHWSQDNAVLVHRRLSILDLSSAAHQPMAWKDDRYWITFNGEIYNWLELRAELQSLGYSFRSECDTEVLLAAYAVWGQDCLRRFNGMWAFAIWDTREKTLFAARDRFGEKPFYYVNFRGCFYFASEIKALLLIPDLPRTLNLPVMSDFLTDRTSDHTETTLIREIHSLPPATWLRWQQGRITQNPYWNFPETTQPVDSSLIVEEVSELLEKSVALRLRADVPIGCLASGGLDSSAIACLMRKKTSAGAATHLFTTRVDPPVEEAKGLDLLVAQGGYEIHIDTPTAQSFWDDLPSVLWHQEAPFADGSMVAHFRLMRLAKSLGVPVLLTGQGADEVFGGYQGYLQVQQGSYLRQNAVGLFLKNLFAQPASQRDWAKAIFYALPSSLRSFVRARKNQKANPWIRQDLSDTRNRMPRYESDRRGEDLFNSILRQSMSRLTLPAFLRYEDRNSMAFGVETRLPYLDYRLVERLFKISGADKVRQGKLKSLLRDASARWVPHAITSNHNKQAYPAPIAQWLRARRTEILAYAASPAIDQSPFLEPRVWRAAVKTFYETAQAPLEPLWRGLIATFWYEQFFKRDFKKDAVNPIERRHSIPHTGTATS